MWKFIDVREERYESVDMRYALFERAQSLAFLLNDN